MNSREVRSYSLLTQFARRSQQIPGLLSRAKLLTPGWSNSGDRWTGRPTIFRRMFIFFTAGLWQHLSLWPLYRSCDPDLPFCLLYLPVLSAFPPFLSAPSTPIRPGSTTPCSPNTQTGELAFLSCYAYCVYMLKFTTIQGSSAWTRAERLQPTCQSWISYRDKTLQVNVMRKYLSSRCWLGVRGERWWVTHHPSGLPDLTRLMNSVLTRTSSLLLCLHSLFLSLTTSNFPPLSRGLIWQQQSSNTYTCWTFKVPHHLSSPLDL